MMFLQILVTAFFGLAACEEPGVSETATKRIGAVVDTLNDILASIENEESEENKSYGDYMSWCQTEAGRVQKAKEAAGLNFEEEQASAKELEATVEQAAQVLSDTEEERKEAQDTIAKAVSIRDSDRDKYEEDKQTNQQSVNQIDEAIKIVGEVHGGAAGFLQVSAMKGSSSAVEQEPGESSYIFGIMKGLKDRLEQTRMSMDSAEKETVERHESFVSTEKSRVNELTGTISSTKQEHTEARVQLVEVEHQRDRLEEQLKELGDLEVEVNRQCEEKKRWWSVRVEDRKLEKESLKQAIDYIKQAPVNATVAAPTPAPALVQVKIKRHRGGAVQHRSLLGAASAQIAALAAGSGGREGMLDAAKEVVKKLIGVLAKEQEDETSMKKYCEAELDKKTGEQASVIAEIERLNASIARKTAEAEVLSEEVTTIEGELAELEATLKDAEKIRRKEKSIYEAGAKDRNLAVKVLLQAKEVLKAFYATADRTALAQAAKDASREAQAPPATASRSSRKDLASAAVVQIVEKLADEISKEETDAAAEEQEAATAFEQLQVDSRAEFDTQMQAITERVKVKAKTLVHLGTDKETHTQKGEDKLAIESQLVSLHKECDELLENFEQRLKARSFEVSQLKDVIEILSGSQVAARTGLVQDDSSDADKEENAAMDARERDLLRDLTQAAGSLVMPRAAS